MPDSFVHPSRLLGALLTAFGLVLCVAGSPAWAEPAAADAHHSITLHIMAKGTGVPLRRVEIKLNSSSKFYSDKDGNLQLSLPGAPFNIEVYRSGYEPLTIGSNELVGKDSLDVYLLPAAPNDNNEVVVRGEKQLEASRKSVTVEEAEKVAPGGDPAQIPKLLPGVQSSAFSPDIVVRGSGPNDSIYLIDDFSVPFIFHLIGDISVVPPQLLSDVEFTSGGFGAQYGNATGGVITLRTKNQVPDRAMTEFRINVPIYSSLYHEEPVNDGKDFVALSARRSYLELFLPAVLKKFSTSDLTVVPTFGDEHVYFVHPTEDGYVKVLGAHAYDGLKLAFDSGISTSANGQATFDVENSFELLGVEWKKDLDSQWSMKLEPSLSNADNSVNILNNNIDIATLVGTMHAELVRKLGGKDRLFLGTEVAGGQARVNVLAPQPNSNDPFYDPLSAPQKKEAETVAVSSEVAWAGADIWLGNLLLTPGLRAFHYSQMTSSGVDPRLNFRYELDKMNALKGAIGQFSETPQYQETDKVFGNPNLKYERSYHYVLGVDTKWNELWESDIQGFYKDIEDLVVSDPNTNFNNNGSLISRGIEIFIRRNLTERLFGWLAYTYSINTQREGPNQLYHNSQYDEVQVLNLVGNYKLSSLWDVGGRAVFHTGDTFTGVDFSVYDGDLDKYEPRQAPGKKLYSDREPPYYELDIYADRDVLFDTWKLTWRFGVEYLALQPQVQGIEYNYDYTRLTYFRGVPPIPYLELRGVI